MIIVNKDRDEAYCLNHIVNFYIASDANAIKAVAGNFTRGGILGKYNSYAETKKAYEIMLERISKCGTEILYMPSDDEVRSRMREGKDTYHHITGKKTKGHGGS